MALYKTDIWQGTSGKWYCNNISDLGKGSGLWYLPARVLGISPAEFIEFLLEKFEPDYYYYSEENNFFSYSWASQVKCNNWKLFINKEARKRNFQI